MTIKLCVNWNTNHFNLKENNMRQLKSIFIAAGLLIAIPAYAETDISAQKRYENVKEQTKYSGSVGFDKRHKAYRDYVLSLRQDNESTLTDIAPAAGEAGHDVEMSGKTGAAEKD